jgi:hypothetical protein
MLVPQWTMLFKLKLSDHFNISLLCLLNVACSTIDYVL